MMPTAVPSVGLSRIVVATDGSLASGNALAWARELARIDARSRVWCLHVVPNLSTSLGVQGTSDAYARGAQEQGHELLRLARAALEGAQSEEMLGFGDAASEIVSLADAVRADLVIVGSHNRHGFERFLLGSVSEAVKERAHASVLVARTPPPPRAILAALDGSERGERAFGLAQRLAEAWHARVVGFQVKDERAAAVSKRAPLKAREVARDVIDQAAAQGASLILAGTRGRGRVRSALLGSVSNDVARHAGASVLVVKDAR